MATTSVHESRLNGSSSSHHNNRFDQSSSPATLRTATSFTIANQTTLSSQPLTADGLLSAHSSTPEPALAALDVAISERNTLSTQNTQLWKLIEKQRSGYSQLMKEVERVRGERDLYRGKLQSMGENTDALLRVHREKERREAREGTLRSTSSHTHLKSSESSISSALDPRGHLVRMNSDDTAVRGTNQQLHHSHSNDHVSRSQPTLREQYGSQTSLNIPSSSSRASSAAPSPLSTNPASSSTSAMPSPFPREGTPEGRKPAVFALSPTQETFPVTARPSSESPSASTSSFNTQRSGAGSALSQLERADPVLGHWQPGSRPSLDSVRPVGQVVLTPAAPATPATPAQPTAPRNSSPARLPHSHRHVSPEKAASSSASSLSPVMNGDSAARGPFALSRESRISLPDEAKRYYANLGDSPMPSPSVGGAGFPSGSGQNSPVKLQMPKIAEAMESVRSQSGTPSGMSLSTRASGERSRKSADEAAPFLDMGDEDSVYSGVEGARTSNVDDGDDSAYDGVDEPSLATSKRSVAEEFPLPPSTPAFAPGQGQASADSSQLNLPPQPSTPVSPFPMASGPPQMKFRALPLLATDLPRTEIHVITSTIRPNDRGKEVLSFVISVNPGKGKEPWNVEKLYSDVLGLDARVRASVSKNVIKKMVTLPEGRLWRDHAPAKVDQRKNALEQYLRSLIALPVKNKDEVIAFFTSDIVREAQKPVSQAGYKEGYLTKRGKNFGGWKSRYFVLQGPSLEYYESRGGAHLGSITITGAQIGRQQRAPDRRDSDEDNEYRHAFLIIEAKRGPAGPSPRHVLCAESDAQRDSWVEELVRYVTGTYSEDQVAVIQNGPSPIVVGSAAAAPIAQSRPSLSSNPPNDVLSTPNRRPRDTSKGVTTPAKLVTDLSNGKLFPNAVTHPEDVVGPVKSAVPSPIDHASLEAPMSSSLPSTSTLVNEDVDVLTAFSTRANSELGHYPDMLGSPGGRLAQSPEQARKKGRRASITPLKATISERTPSPDKETASLNTPRVDSHGKVKISAPMNGTPIPAGYKFGGKDAPPAESSTTASERREKAKSRGFWAFSRHEKANVPAAVPRAVFGVPLDESLEVAQIASLPAIVFRCIQYLEAKEAELEEGIYRLSGSSAVIKGLKDRFNMEGDIDLLGSDEYWDPHAIAGLLKTFLRDLPASILTRDLHLRFLAVIDFVDPQERIKELSRLIASLPIANYSLLRALTAHLILIVQNANVNKMTMRNVGIVFSPTLGIPAGVFSLMLGEFKRVFNVDGSLDEEESQAAPENEEEEGATIDRRNSRRYTDAAADRLLGLSGRALPVADEGPSDEGEEASVIEGSAEDTTENENDSDLVESSATSSSAHLPQGAAGTDSLHPPEANGGLAPASPAARSRASHLAATRGLNIAVTDKASHRHSRVIGIPVSPRPSPRSVPSGAPSPVVPSPLSTPR